MPLKVKRKKMRTFLIRRAQSGGVQSGSTPALPKRNVALATPARHVTPNAVAATLMRPKMKLTKMSLPKRHTNFRDQSVKHAHAGRMTQLSTTNHHSAAALVPSIIAFNRFTKSYAKTKKQVKQRSQLLPTGVRRMSPAGARFTLLQVHLVDLVVHNRSSADQKAKAQSVGLIRTAVMMTDPVESKALEEALA